MWIKKKSIFIILLGLHGKLLGINIAHKNKFKWAVCKCQYKNVQF